MTPDVTVVIPVFARQAMAETALRSVLAQDGVSMEILIVDDGSPVPFILPPDVVEDARIRLIRQENAGAAAARNAGVRAARAAWVAFLDSDDVWWPGKLKGQMGYAADGIRNIHGPLTVVVCGFLQIEVATGVDKTRLPIESRRVEDFAAGCWFGPGTTALVPVTAFDRIGHFDESLTRLEDLDWYLRLALAGGGIVTWPELAASVYVGGRPSVERVDGAAAKLRTKWLGTRVLDAVSRRNLSAYLALEQASARRHSGRWLAFAYHMLRSLWLKPRLSISLRRWWSDSPLPPTTNSRHQGTKSTPST